MKKYLMSWALIWLLAFSGWSQQGVDFKLHSHNDYLQPVPFWIVYAHNCASIEVDVILHNGQLMVAHEEESIVSTRTLQTTYLEPIRQAKQLHLDQPLNFQLLIDLKTEAYSTLAEVVKVLNDYRDILVSPENRDGIHVVISGNRPKVQDYVHYPEHIQFDYQDTTFTEDLPWKKIALVSLNFKQFSGWNGKGRLVEEELQPIRALVEKVHQTGKPIRFWGTPDSKTAWKAFYDLGIDLINTDKPFEANRYLAALPKNVYQARRRHELYHPTFASDGKPAPIRHIILMIGDGNGLAQISAGMFAHGNALNLAGLKNIGLIKTQSADDFTTDSAAGGSALATGKKSNNRGIGQTPDGKPAANLPEILQAYHFISGIVTTDHVTGATPAAFYAHQKERDRIAEIAADLSQSHLNLFIGGGKSDFLRYGTNQLKHLEDAGFQLLNSLEELQHTSSDKVGYFASHQGLPTVANGREGFLAKATGQALGYLKSSNKPLFLMIEGAMIDVGGHWNSAKTIIEEEIDFDQAIGEVLKFADENPGTLVIITADHETGGVTIPQGNLKEGLVELDFQSDDHTAIMVPLFAYGPHADEFRGVYDNTEVFDKILRLVRLYHRE